MKVTLRIDKKDKTFVQDFVSALHYRKALELNKEILSGELEAEEIYDKITERVVLAFDNQFTVEEFMNGVRSTDYDDECKRLFHTILGIYESENEETENVEEGK